MSLITFPLSRKTEPENVVNSNHYDIDQVIIPISHKCMLIK